MSSVCSNLTRITLLLSLLMASAPATAQGKTLSSKAQMAFDQGVAAAHDQDWKLAIRNFLDAQRADSGATQIWFNLGLASSKIPTNEFRAIAWFKAYLLANPSAQNRDAVREQVSQLEVAYESRLTMIVNVLEKVSRSGMDQAINDMNTRPQNDFHTPAHDEIYSPAILGGLFATMRLNLGDIAGAKKTLASFGVSPFQQCRSQEQFLPEHFKLAVKMASISEFHNCAANGYPLEMTHRNDANSIAGLLARARDGEELNVPQFEETEQYRARKFDETRLDELVDALRGDLQIYDGLNPPTDGTAAYDGDPSVGAERGNAMAKSMNCLATLIASYRQMRGPYGP